MKQIIYGFLIFLTYFTSLQESEIKAKYEKKVNTLVQY